MNKFINLFLVIFSLSSYASLSIDHLSFEATQKCAVYLSKNKHSNPDNLYIEKNKIYSVREINSSSPTWFRIELGEEHRLYWVSKYCGLVQQSTSIDDTCTSIDSADSHVLALSLQPGFCETYGYEAGKPECRYLAPNSYQAKHLTLHGLWPNKNSCGLHYGYCAVMPQPNHCDYAPIALSSEVANQLKQFMPSYFYGSCLERHEWNKHGSCQSLPVNDYFALAMRLTQEIDLSEFGQLLRAYQGQIISHSVLRDGINKILGINNAGKVYLGCKNGILIDIFIQLPAALISDDEPLASLVTRAPDAQYKDSCPDKIMISNFSKDTWF